MATSTDPALTERLYRSLRLIRRAEEEIARIYPSDRIKSPVHLSIGQEFVSVGICDALRADDVVSGTYRSHAAYLAKGGDLDGMMAELFGKAGGCARGKGGSMHLVDMNRFVLGASAVVGTTIPLAAGYALALKREGRGRIVAAFFGDGATEEGVFGEALNFAALHKLPILFICENNGLAIHSPLSNRWASDALCQRVESYGIPARRLADGDVFAVRGLAAQAAARLRQGDGPLFAEILCYRWHEHVGPNLDYDAGYRDAEALAPWRDSDQVTRLAALLPEALRGAIDAEVEDRIRRAVAFAEASPEPAPQALWDDVYA